MKPAYHRVCDGPAELEDDGIDRWFWCWKCQRDVNPSEVHMNTIDDFDFSDEEPTKPMAFETLEVEAERWRQERELARERLATTERPTKNIRPISRNA